MSDLRGARDLLLPGLAHEEGRLDKPSVELDIVIIGRSLFVAAYDRETKNMLLHLLASEQEIADGTYKHHWPRMRAIAEAATRGDFNLRDEYGGPHYDPDMRLTSGKCNSPSQVLARGEI